MATTLSSLRLFLNLRWQVNEVTRLSISSWQRGDGVFVYAVALLNKQGKRWVVNHASAAEFCGADEEDMAYRSTDYGAKLVARVLGECPLSFFRNAAL